MTHSNALGEIDQHQTRSLMMAWRVHEFGSPNVMRFENVPRPGVSSGEVWFWQLQLAHFGNLIWPTPTS